MPEKIKTNTLSDEDVEQASGGAGFNKCPLGHCEATSIANVLGVLADCNQNRCGQCDITYLGEFKDVTGYTMYSYSFHCHYFNRTRKYDFDVRL